MTSRPRSYKTQPLITLDELIEAARPHGKLSVWHRNDPKTYQQATYQKKLRFIANALGWKVQGPSRSRKQRVRWRFVSRKELVDMVAALGVSSKGEWLKKDMASYSEAWKRGIHNQVAAELWGNATRVEARG